MSRSHQPRTLAVLAATAFAAAVVPVLGAGTASATTGGSCQSATVQYRIDGGEWTSQGGFHSLASAPGTVEVRLAPGQSVGEGCKYPVSLAEYTTEGPNWNTSGRQTFIEKDTVYLTSADVADAGGAEQRLAEAEREDPGLLRADRPVRRRHRVRRPGGGGSWPRPLPARQRGHALPPHSGLERRRQGVRHRRVRAARPHAVGAGAEHPGHPETPRPPRRPRAASRPPRSRPRRPPPRPPPRRPPPRTCPRRSRRRPPARSPRPARAPRRWRRPAQARRSARSPVRRPWWSPSEPVRSSCPAAPAAPDERPRDRSGPVARQPRQPRLRREAGLSPRSGCRTVIDAEFRGFTRKVESGASWPGRSPARNVRTASR